MNTAPGVCAWMGQMQRTHFTAGYTLYNCVCEKKKRKTIRLSFFLFQNRYPIMVKCLNIGKPIYRSISNYKSHILPPFLCYLKPSMTTSKYSNNTIKFFNVNISLIILMVPFRQLL